MTLKEVAERIRAKAERAGFARSVRFDLGSEGIIVLDGTAVSTEDSEADCTITISLENLDALSSGDLNPTMAFMSGKLKVDGDMSAAMAVAQII